MSDTGSGDESVAASETPTEQGGVVSEQATPEASGPTLRVTGHDLFDTFTWRADDDADPVVITRDGTVVPEDEVQNIVASAARGGIKLEVVG